MSLTGDYFYDIIVMPDNDEDDPVILEGVEWLVEVLQDGEWADAQVYTNENLSDVVVDYVTDESGEIAFWASMGEYRITITDLEDPARITPRYIYWMSIPYRDFDALRFAGEIVMTGRTVAPDGWLICDGSAVSRTEYVRLWEAIGTAYGVGDGGTTFNIPDLRGRVPIGLGTNASTTDLGQNEGQAESVRKPTHSHTQPTHAHAMPHTHIGSAAGVEGLATSSNGDHAHLYEGGKGVHTRRNASETSGDAATYQFRRADLLGGSDEYQPFDKQSLYIAGFNAASGGGAYDSAAAMDTEGAHQHTVDIAGGSVLVGQPSADNVANGGADNTNEMTVPYQIVNYMIRTR